MIAVFLNNLVPYHQARWNSYASLHAAPCLLIEITSRDSFRVLEVEEKKTGDCQRTTLFPGRPFDQVSRREMRTAVECVLDEHRPSVVCLNGYSFLYNWAALGWCLRHKVPAIVCSESNEFDEVRRPWKEAVKRFFVSHCAAGLAGGQSQADYLIKLGLPSARVFTGYDIVDNDHFSDGAAIARAQAYDLRKKLALPENYFLACSRFGQKKNLPRLIKAFARYRQLAVNEKVKSEESKIWDLVVVGDGEEKALIEKAMAECQVVPFVHLVGAKAYDQLPYYYGLASAFIHASTTEQWGLVVNEAMASGLPVLVSNRCGCASDLVREGVNGFTFDPADEAEIARKMLRIANDAALLSTMGSASCKIIANWSPEKFARGISQAIKVAHSQQSSSATWIERLFIWILMHR
jgi:glycosyltransferase involved in cell wall biosynthesis